MHTQIKEIIADGAANMMELGEEVAETVTNTAEDVDSSDVALLGLGGGVAAAAIYQGSKPLSSTIAPGGILDGFQHQSANVKFKLKVFVWRVLS